MKGAKNKTGNEDKKVKMKTYKAIVLAIILPASLVLASCQPAETTALDSKLSVIQTSIAEIHQQIGSQANAGLASATQAPAVLAKVIVNNSAVRSNPDNQSTVVETLYIGEIVKLLDVDASVKWVRVETSIGSDGWMSAQQIFTAADLKAFNKSQAEGAAAPAAGTPKAAGSIDWSEAGKYIGEYKTVCRPVIDSNYATSIDGAPTFLDIGKAYPDAGRFTVLIWKNNRANFPENPETAYNGKTICVYGLIQSNTGTAEIEATKSDQIQIQ
jgi:uncharacterized protein YgiM (DUF1202 family)